MSKEFEIGNWDGSSQHHRLLKALVPDYIKVDEREFEDFIFQFLGYSQYINYFNNTNIKEGNWAPFFKKDESFVLADILNFDLHSLETRFESNLSDRQSLSLIQESRITDWLNTYDELEEVRFHIIHTSLKNIVASKEWLSKKNRKELKYLSPESTEDFYVFQDNILSLKKLAGEFIENSIKSIVHKPHVALPLTFFKLFKTAQDNINDFSERRLEYYYHEILKESRKGAEPNKVILNFAINPEEDQVLVPTGSRFLAGNYPNGDEIVYETTKNLLLNKEQVSRVLIQSPQIIDKKPLKFINELKSAALETNEKSFQIDETGFNSVIVGWAISSRELFLLEGERTITLHFELSKSSIKQLKWRLKTMDGSSDDMELLFERYFCDAFRYYVTTEKDWTEITDSCVFLDSSIRIRLRLQSAFPSTKGYKKEVHKESYGKEGTPYLKIILNTENALNAYSFLKGLDLETIKIDTEVRELSGLKISNSLGPLNSVDPFMPFGPIPRVGYFLDINHPEFNIKQIHQVSIGLKWANLIKGSDPFKKYYKGYSVPFSADLFKVSIQSERLGTLISEPVQHLYQNADCKQLPQKFVGPLNSWTWFNSIRFIPPTRNSSDNASRSLKIELKEPGYAFGHILYPDVISEFNLKKWNTGLFEALFKVVVKDIKALINVFLKLASLIFKFLPKKLKEKKLPKEPWTPLVNKLSVEYNSSANYRLHEGSHEEGFNLVQITPFGYINMDTGTKESTGLVNDISENVNLFIGLSGLKTPKEISLMFNVGNLSTHKEHSPLRFYCLHNEEWIKPEVTSDTTEGLQHSGVIRIKIPAFLDKNHTQLPSGFHWICLWLYDGQNFLPNLRDIRCNSSEAVLKLEKKVSQHLDFILPEIPVNTITRSKERINGIASLNQPVASYGGKPFEDQTSFHIRVSERLRHKQRVVNPWDYESYVLEKFPEVFKVKCVSGKNKMLKAAAGNILVVVIPHKHQDSGPFEYPCFNRDQLIAIENELNKVSPAYANIHVVNSLYDRVKVIAKITFMKDSIMDQLIMENKVREEIYNYISPWARFKKRNALLGGKIYKSDLKGQLMKLDFIESIENLILNRISEVPKLGFELTESESINASSSTDDLGESNLEIGAFSVQSLLVPNENHTLLLRENFKQTEIGVMEIEDNLII